MNCKYFKKRTHNNKKEKRIYYYCTFLRKEVSFSCYKECDCGPVTNHKVVHKKNKSSFSSIKHRTYKQAKKEKNRYSLFTEDLEHCIICGLPNVNLHEIFGGRNRSNSIKYGLVIPLCTKRHHNQIEKKESALILL